MLVTMEDSTEVLSIPRRGSWGCRLHSPDFWAGFQGVDIIVALLAVCATTAWLYVYRASQKKRRGPKIWPIIGAILEIQRNWSRLYDWLEEYLQKHQVAIVQFPFGFKGFYLADPLSVEHILRTKFYNYPKGTYFNDIFSELFGEGIFASDGCQWKQQRKTASFEFASSVLRDFSAVVFKEGALKLIRIVDAISKSSTSFDFQDLFLRMTLDSTAKVGFGIDLGCLAPSLPAVPFCVAFDTVSQLSVYRYVDSLWRLKRYFSIGREKVIKENVKLLDSFSYGVIKIRREEMRAAKADGRVTVRQDLLSRFMNLSDGPDANLSDQALRDHTLNFIIAGRDTVAVALSWFIYILCLHPHVADKIFEEMCAFEKQQCLFGIQSDADEFSKFAEILSYASVTHLQYLHAALSETLRLYPPVPLDPVMAAEDDVLPDGTRVKRGDMVTFCPYPMGRLESIWGPDAREFKPERWLENGEYQKDSPFKFTAFKAGPRACLGKDSAYLQMKMTAALLFRFFKFELVPDQHVFYRVMVTLNMQNGVHVFATRR